MKNYMKPVTIKKLLSKKANSGLLTKIMNDLDGSAAVYDAAGTKIAGKTGTNDARSPVRLNGETIGWVSGNKGATIIASILSHIAEKERDIKSLANETLDKYKELTMLYALNERMALSLDPGEIAHVIIDEAVRMIKADSASIMLMDGDKNILRVLAAQGRECHPKTELKSGEGIAGYVFYSGKAEIVNEAASDKRFVAGSNRISSLMCAPLRVKDKVLGVINIGSERPCDYTAADLKLLTTLASQAAAAIEIARLYDSEKKQKETLARENINLSLNLRRTFSPARIIGASRQMRDILDKIEKIADAPLNVLITGETGTGKELIAKAVHYNSSRAGKQFTAINCSAIPETIFESEMFGIEKGVATGVDKRIGKIEQANGGTLFLDEIGDMPLTGQIKILRVIEEREVERVGGRESIPVDIRIIAATNKDLKKEVESGRFREDLFYRLRVLHFHIPPLRERKEDIALLLNYFIDQCVKKFGKPPMRFSKEAAGLFMEYSWPGNVRELENEIERAVALSTSEIIGVYDISEEIRKSAEQVPSTSGQTDAESERQIIQQTLAGTGGNKSEAARQLGLSREGLRKKMKRCGLI
jgi:transcriptional regulator with GAF, ATPase, and Fis domain